MRAPKRRRGSAGKQTRAVVRSERVERDRSDRIVSRPADREPSRESLSRPVDPNRGSAVETSPAVVVSVVTPSSGTLDKEHFGAVLRRAREDRAILLSDVAQKTKIARTTLELIEKGDLAQLPAGVYVRGFIRSFARAVGADETQPLAIYDRAVETRNAAEKAKDLIPTVAPWTMDRGASLEDESMAPRRGMGLAVFVIILLLIATITLSLLLRRPPQSGEGLSFLPGAPSCSSPGSFRQV